MKRIGLRKTIFIFIISLLYMACGSLEERNEPELPSHGTTTEIGYLSVELSAVGNPTTRDADLGFENGSASENAVNSIRLYFFDATASVMYVRNGETFSEEFESYLEFNPGEFTSVDDEENVEKKFSMTFLLETSSGGIPSSLLAIVNPDSYISSLNITNLTSLKEAVSDFSTNLTDRNFVMSNSSYVTGDWTSKTEINAFPLLRSVFKPYKQEAADNPVSIYVERVVARLDLSFDTSSEGLKSKEINGKKVFETGVRFKPHDADEDDEKEIYVEFLGWAVTSSPAKSRLLKAVDKNWNSTDLFKGGMDWNNPALFRSFWAINPPEPDYKWFSFDDIAGERTERKEGCFPVDIESKAVTYIQENANPYAQGSVRAANPEYPTKVIVAARLIDSAGEPVTVVEYDSKFYALESLYEEVAGKLHLFTPIVGENGYREIDTSDLTLETSMDHKNQSGPDSEGTYNVFFTLKDASKELDWFLREDNDEETIYTKVYDPVGYIDDRIEEVKVWNEGLAYYYFDIPHFGVNAVNPGYYGVVRNHLYNAKVIKITSLGTPVYNPEEVIYPEKPPTSGNSLIVSVQVLKWRLAKQHFQISW